MGIVKWVKTFLQKRYSSDDPALNAFPSKFELWAKTHDPNWGFVLIVDMMQYMKHKPDDVRTLGDLLVYIMGHVRRKIDMYKGRARVIVLCWDQPARTHKSNVVKQICYAKRYKNVDFYPEEEGPYLPKTLDGQLPPEWNRFCGNSNLLRRELFPHIYNCCLGKGNTPIWGHLYVATSYTNLVCGFSLTLFFLFFLPRLPLYSVELWAAPCDARASRAHL